MYKSTSELGIPLYTGQQLGVLYREAPLYYTNASLIYLGVAGVLSMNGETLSNQWICSLTGQKWVALSHRGGTDAQRWWLAASCIDWWTSVSVGEEYGRHVLMHVLVCW